jgi:hypothetical protein
MAFGPHDAATHALRRAENLLDAATTDGIPPAVAGDMRRSSVVLAIAALDAYMHRLIVDQSDMWDSLPAKLAGLEVRFDQLVDGAKASYNAARREPFKSRPGVHVKNVLRNQLLSKSFQSPQHIENALTMAGASGNWESIGTHMGMTKKQISDRLSPIVLRRNQIAHEGDYERKDRPRTPRLNSISDADARSDIQFLRSLVDAINSIT